MAEHKILRTFVGILYACIIASLLNIGAMTIVSKTLGPQLSMRTIYFSILPGTLVGAFLLSYFMRTKKKKSKGWLWGILIPLILMILACFAHQDKIHDTILIYVLQIVPAGLVGEMGQLLWK